MRSFRICTPYPRSNWGEVDGARSAYGENRVVYRVMVGTPEGKNPLRRAWHKWEDNIKMDLQDMGCEGMDWIDVAQVRDGLQALLNVKVIYSVKTPYVNNQHCKRGYVATCFGSLNHLQASS